MHTVDAVVPAKRHHSQISMPASSSSSSNTYPSSRTAHRNTNHGHHPFENFMHMFGSTFHRSSRTQQQQQQQQSQSQERQQPEQQQQRVQQQQQTQQAQQSRPSAEHQQHSNSRQSKQAKPTEYDMMLGSSSNYIPPTVHVGHNDGTTASKYTTKPRTISPTNSSTSPTSSSTNAAAQWRTALCPRSNKPYYWNVHTRESRWKKPLELATEEEREAICSKERKLKEFFEGMEKNILKRLEDGRVAMEAANNAAAVDANAATNNAAYGTTIGLESPMSVATSVKTEAASHTHTGDGIDQSWMKLGTASPTEQTTSTEDWIAGWITPTSNDSQSLQATPSDSPSNRSLSLSSMDGLSVFDAATNLCTGSIGRFSPASLEGSLESFAEGSMSSSSREERDDEVYPLGDHRPSKIERIKSSSSRPVIDKPNLIRTISKMEYELLVHQLNPSMRGIQAGSIGSVGGPLDSPRMIGPTSNRDEPLTPTTQTCHILSSLSLSYAVSTENEGVNVSLANSGLAMSMPTSPLTPITPNDEDDASLPIRSLSSPTSVTTATSAATDGARREGLVKPNLTKRNTCSTIYLGSTLSAPDKDALIKCVCGVYRAHLLQSELRGFDSNFANDDYLIFQDRRAPGDYRSLDTSSIPTLAAITDFYRSIFLRSQMEVDCIIISLIYIERLIKMTSGKLSPKPNNWRSILFSCMVMASKVWDDLSMWNCDFSKIGPSGVTFSLARTNELELALLRALEYKVKVNASEYAKYYFLLRGMLCRSGLANDDIARLRPLDVKGADAMNLDAVVTKSGSGDGETGTAGAVVAKVLMKERSKSYGCVEDNKNAQAIRTGSKDDGGLSPQSSSPASKRVSLEQIVRM